MDGVLIAGGGIAGLTMALTCHEIGVPATVFEAADELRPLGLGINMQPSAVRALYALGFEDALDSISVPVDEVALVARDGAAVWSEPRGLDAGSRWPQLSVHRGALEMMLYREAVERLGPAAIVTGCRVTGYGHTLDGVRVECGLLDGTVEQAEASVLLGADGLHSAVRAQMFPGEGSPRWGGSVLWRGVADHRPVRGGRSFVVVGNRRQRFVTFPIAATDPVSGMQRQDWIAELKFDPMRGWRRGDWNTIVSADEFLADFEDWAFDWLDVPALIRSSEVVYEYPMVDRDPVDRWVHGSVALIGDAAHPMYPVGSNGASQAIVDARLVGKAFLDHGVGRAALRAFEVGRLDEMSELVVDSRLAGPASVLGALDERSRSIFDDLDAVAPADVERYIADFRRDARQSIDAFNAAPPTIERGTRA